MTYDNHGAIDHKYSELPNKRNNDYGAQFVPILNWGCTDANKNDLSMFMVEDNDESLRTGLDECINWCRYDNSGICVEIEFNPSQATWCKGFKAGCSTYGAITESTYLKIGGMIQKSST